MSGKLLELAELCERATGPDRSIDWAIHLRDGLTGVGSYGGHPAYTASIDTAMSLILDDHWRVEDHPMAGPCAIVGEQEGYAATPALALCAAALRARAQATPQGETV